MAAHTQNTETLHTTSNHLNHTHTHTHTPHTQIHTNTHTDTHTHTHTDTHTHTHTHTQTQDLHVFGCHPHPEWLHSAKQHRGTGFRAARSDKTLPLHHS